MKMLLSDYGMVFVLILLGIFFSVATWAEQHPTGTAAAESLVPLIEEKFGSGARVVIVVRDSARDAAFAKELRTQLERRGLTVIATIEGQPAAARQALEKLPPCDAFVCNRASSIWTIYPEGVPILRPPTYFWPNFLKPDNLLNIANQIAVIAIMAIGMTLVVIAGGIDLSVGSLIALAAVVTTRLIRDYGGGVEASAVALVGCGLAAIMLCGLAGLFSGLMITHFQVPAFIVTLAMMEMASGFAYQLAEGQSIDQVPESFIWLGRGADWLHLPNAVVLMLVLYVLAHVVMTRTILGRYIYAVGGNAEAARLSGVPVARVVWTVFVLSGALAGLGGVILASQLKSGAPTYGEKYELYAIAAVVVGGTSLAGGKGKIIGTAIGAFIIAVIQNGMNLTGVESYTQKVVLGAVILGAVLVDRIRLTFSNR